MPQGLYQAMREKLEEWAPDLKMLLNSNGLDPTIRGDEIGFGVPAQIYTSRIGTKSIILTAYQPILP